MVIKDGEDLRHWKDLDAITTKTPIYLNGFYHHSTLVNTLAMINAGIVNENGSIIRDHIAGEFMYRNDKEAFRPYTRDGRRSRTPLRSGI